MLIFLCNVAEINVANFEIILIFVFAIFSISGYTFTMSDNYYGNIRTERYGITGKVCKEGWDDNDAKVMCKKAGHFSGLRLNTFSTQ